MCLLTIPYVSLYQHQYIIIDRGISAPGHGKYLVDGLNVIHKRYIYKLMSNVQLPGSKTFDSHILMNYCTPKNDVSLAKQFQKHMSKEHCKHGVIDQGNYRKRFSKRKWTYREFHIQDNSDVAHKDLKIYYDTSQLPAFPFCGPHPKPHGASGLSKHCHLRFYTKLGHVICAINLIPCACVACTPMIDKPWISGIPSKKSRYQPFRDCTYWLVLGSFNNYNIIHMSPKSTHFEAF